MATGRKVLVVGSGGREHALAWRLLESPSVAEVIVTPGNAGTALRPQQAPPGKTLRNAAGRAVDLALAEKVDLVVVGPEAPLCAGIVDDLAAAGVLAYGPSAAAARLEGSKAFMKEFAVRHGVPTARFERVTDVAQAQRAMREFPEPPVVKADGLAAGKGVIIPRSHDEALSAECACHLRRGAV
jgi:phosphoribosylamine--glycine ligase